MVTRQRRISPIMTPQAGYHKIPKIRRISARARVSPSCEPGSRALFCLFFRLAAGISDTLLLVDTQKQNGTNDEKDQHGCHTRPLSPNRSREPQQKRP